MGDGVKISGGVPYQAPVNDSNKVDDAKSKEPKAETPPPVQPKDKPAVSNTSGRRLEQNINGTARQAELRGQLNRKTGESIETAKKILENPKLSNEAKIAQLQKTIEKLDKNEFALFMKKFPSFSMEQKKLVHSAITESEKIMDRVGAELSQAEQLTVVWNGLMDPSPGKSAKEEQKRLERTDKAMAAWMRSTDADTLNKALDGKNIDMRASAKLYGVLISPAAGMPILSKHEKVFGDNHQLAMELMQIVHGPQGQGSYSRAEIEKMAETLIVRQFQDQAGPPNTGSSGRRDPNVTPPFRSN